MRSFLPLLTLAGLAACHASVTPRATPVPEPVPLDVGPSSPSAIAQARADSMRLPYTTADIQFMAGMIGHHAQAIEMAKMAPSHGASPMIRTLAGRIINAQQDEIVLMQRWLRDRSQVPPMIMPTLPAAGGAMDHSQHMGHDMGGMANHAMMPGMLSVEQMQQLDRARGAEFDRLFLTFMIQHHEGATAMVATLFATDGAGQDETVFKFASDVNVDQTTEIARMRGLLSALPTQRSTK